jgi:hypothetical protein
MKADQLGRQATIICINSSVSGKLRESWATHDCRGEAARCLSVTTCPRRSGPPCRWRGRNWRRLLGDNLLQVLRLMPQILDLAAGRSTRRVARKSSLAGFQELLRPAVIKALGNLLAPAELRNRMLAAEPIEHNTDIFFGQILLTGRPANVFTSRSDDESNCPDFCLISTSEWLR